MRRKLKLGAGLFLAMVTLEVSALTFDSAPMRPAVIELFTSEGCSSCPPAERWLNTFSRREGLWRDYFPMAWHVDYWDSIGWPDRFASQRYSQRQRRYQQQTSLRSVYTPGMLVNGAAWRGWVSGRVPAGGEDAAIGRLQVELNQRNFQASFSPATAGATNDYTLHAAVLGFGLSTAVKRGENAGKTLQHDFVVLAAAAFNTDSSQWQGTLPEVSAAAEGANKLAVVFWLESPRSPVPLQIAGGWLAD